jgi:very-short-patch-repair endonuclease
MWTHCLAFAKNLRSTSFDAEATRTRILRDMAFAKFIDNIRGQPDIVGKYVRDFSVAAINNVH